MTPKAKPARREYAPGQWTNLAEEANDGGDGTVEPVVNVYTKLKDQKQCSACALWGRRRFFGDDEWRENRPGAGSASRRSAPPRTPRCTPARQTSSPVTAAAADASPGAPNPPASPARPRPTTPRPATSRPPRRDSRRSASASAMTTTPTRPPRSESPAFAPVPPRPRPHDPPPRAGSEPTTPTLPSPRCTVRRCTPDSATDPRRGRPRPPSRPRCTDPRPPPRTSPVPSRTARTRETRRDASPAAAAAAVDFARRRRRPRSARTAAIPSTNRRRRRDRRSGRSIAAAPPSARPAARARVKVSSRDPATIRIPIRTRVVRTRTVAAVRLHRGRRRNRRRSASRASSIGSGRKFPRRTGSARPARASGRVGARVAA